MPEESSKMTDPVCGMTVEPATAAASVEHEGHTYYFCGKGCAKSFTADPGKYTNAAVSYRSWPGAKGCTPAGAPTATVTALRRTNVAREGTPKNDLLCWLRRVRVQ